MVLHQQLQRPLQTAKPVRHFSKMPPSLCAAFTLLELIIVIVILAILAIFVQSKFQDDNSYQLDAAVEQIISTARLAQQFSMNDNSRNFVLSIQASQVDILADGISLSGQLPNLPVNFSSDISLSPAQLISFDGMGSTGSQTLIVSAKSSINICFEASGMIHRC
ncbi:prepilin-type N-terminal cleavage/methylation domain-containing protein [Aliikangiella sp. G2MR2-5]|uniref:prepilin-type N-terminal cleavage/methylation domain-containing protein n=1 Tax=Aliikangiella sp. G2MR2-5 TaxID=2788943 RepID=UPI001FEFD14E|nr:prepilin-type N-terminal cleavage/methylation domain-containing protein [Aliikangiella sp. G2MR2-5]